MPHKQFKITQVPDLRPSNKHTFKYSACFFITITFGIIAALSLFFFSIDRFFVVSSLQLAIALATVLPFLGVLFHVLFHSAPEQSAAPSHIHINQAQLAVAKAMVDAVNRADATGQQHHEIDVLSAISHQLQHAGSAVILTKDMGVVHKHLRSRFAITTRGFGYTPMYTRLSLALRDAAPTPVLRA